MKKNIHTYKKSIFVSAAVLLGAIGAFSFFINGNDAQSVSAANLLDCKDCNVLMINLGGARKDHLSAYGYGKNTTPSISTLAEKGIVFSNAFTQAPQGVAAKSSLLTSLYPYTHGMEDRMVAQSNLNLNAKTITEVLQENGYQTGAFFKQGEWTNLSIGSEPAKDWFSRGFSSVDTTLTTAEVVEWLGKNKNDKFFLYLRGFNTGCPYSPPAPYNTMFDPGYENTNNIDYSKCYWSYANTQPLASGEFPLFEGTEKSPIPEGATAEEIAVHKELTTVLFDEKDIEHLVSLYDGNIAYADSQIGEILDALGELNLDGNTIVVFLSDRGELFGEGGKFKLAAYLTGTFHDAVLNVPLVMKYPNMTAAKQVDGLAQIIDIAPTILASLGINDDRAAQGKDLSRLINTGEEANEYIYAGTSQYRSQCSRHPSAGLNEVDVIRDKNWKLIREVVGDHADGSIVETFALYNISKDPKEMNNILDKEPTVANDLKAKLSNWVSDTNTTGSTIFSIDSTIFEWFR